MEDVARLVKYIYVMYKGKIHMEGNPHEIYRDSEELKRIGLGVPQVVDIMKALKKKGIDVDTNKLTVEEATNEILKALRSKQDV